MSKAPVVFDIDGVLADFYAGYYDVMKMLNKPAPRIGNWNDFWDKDAWAYIRQSPTFWAVLPPLVSWSVFERINKLQGEREVYFATSRHGVRAKVQTENWLRVASILRPTVIVTGKKGEFCRVVSAEYMIDDKAGNCVFTGYHAEVTTPYLLDAPWNQFDHDVLGQKVNRIKTVEEFLDIVEAGK